MRAVGVDCPEPGCPKDVKHSGHTSFAVRMVELRLHASFEFHTAPYHVDIVRARVYVLDSRFQIPDLGSGFSERGGVPHHSWGRVLKISRCDTPFMDSRLKDVKV
jgi:hypothetical protein